MKSDGWGARGTAEPSRQHCSNQLVEGYVIGGVGAYGVGTQHGRIDQTRGASFVHRVAAEGVEETTYAWIARVIDTDGRFRRAVNGVALHEIEVAANIDRIEDVSLRYRVFHDRVGVAVAGARTTKGGVDEDPDLCVPDRVPRNCDPL